ncbi:TetR/AcrR family transcriptional regulator [Amycolatopsis sp. YIM 10]|uniref:TetR/AcrR family transcriptional regulator n=1 Tax=Amycolatopsis sp. YIM 10 TaxID=2653857 RepID=UPI0012906672|nr:TetR/AcrR family transcriptional regulator [Amycolatopsis sp. YIM 10]QFU92655.1 DNA-binding transcriptional repressor AcrR [Amycolatopsis sp. YIM 10]
MSRYGRSVSTRESILTAAERLFAEHGITAVSHRQIGEAAGQGNNFAVGYHFGDRTALVRAILDRHAKPIEHRRVRMIERIDGHGEVRDWIACLVRPFTEHLAELGSPTWFARFGEQVLTDPVLRRVVVDDALAGEPVRRVVERLNHCLPALPVPVHLERGDMARHLISHGCAERERALADGTGRQDSWEHTTTGLIDAITGLWTAPVTPAGR